MRKITMRWARADPLSICIESELIVGADLHEEMVGDLPKLDDLAEVQHRLIALRRVRGSDPPCAPQVPREFRGQLRRRGDQRQYHAS